MLGRGLDLRSSKSFPILIILWVSVFCFLYISASLGLVLMCCLLCICGVLINNSVRNLKLLCILLLLLIINSAHPSLAEEIPLKDMVVILAWPMTRHGPGFLTWLQE